MSDPPAGRRARGRSSTAQSFPTWTPPIGLESTLESGCVSVRKESGLTQENAAGAAGITRTTGSRSLRKPDFPTRRLQHSAPPHEGLRAGVGGRVARSHVPSARLVAAWEEEGWDSPRKENSR